VWRAVWQACSAPSSLQAEGQAEAGATGMAVAACAVMRCRAAMPAGTDR